MLIKTKQSVAAIYKAARGKNSGEVYKKYYFN